jgi:hypothetical protein
MHSYQPSMNEVKIQTFWSETKMDAGLKNSGMTFYEYCNIVEISKPSPMAMVLDCQSATGGIQRLPEQFTVINYHQVYYRP